MGTSRSDVPIEPRVRSGTRGSAGALRAMTLALATVLVLLAATNGRAQEGYEGLPVKRIEFVGLKKIDESVARQRMQTKEGSAFSAIVLSEDIRGLGADFAGVRVDSRLEDGSLVLTVHVTEKPFVTRVSFQGLDDLEEDELRTALGAEASGSRFLNEFSLNLMKTQIVDFAREQGYRWIEVDWKLKPAEGEYEAVFEIVEGPKVTVDEIRVKGNRHVPRGKILGVMVTQESGFLTRGLFDQKTLEQDIVQIQRLYRDESYRDARVTLEDLRFSSDRSEAYVTIHVEEGPSYEVASVEVSGKRREEDGKIVETPLRLFTKEEIFSKLELGPGDLFLGDDLRRDELTIRRMYEEQAYIKVAVTTVDTYALDSNKVALRYEIDEGEKYTLGEIRVKGNRLTKDKVILRQFSVYPGQPINRRELDKSVQELLALTYFEPQSLQASSLKDRPGAANVVDFEVAVEEARTGSLRFAAGVGSESGVIGQVSITKRNFDIADMPSSVADVIDGEAFTGAGQALFLELAPGTEISRYLLGFREPYLFDTNNSFGIDFYRRSRIRDLYDETHIGLEPTLGRKFEAFNRELGVEWGYRYESVEIDNIDDNFRDADRDGQRDAGETEDKVPQLVLDSEGTTYVSAMRFGVNWRRVDSPLFPSEGFEGGASYELFGNFLGAEVDMSRIIGQYSRYLPIYEDLQERKHVIAFRSTVGWSEENSNTEDVPIFERFYAGGTSTIRGFEYRTVGPQEFDEPIGGKFEVLLGSEYRFPLYERIFYGAFFVDSGEVSEDIRKFRMSDYRVSAGFGIRFIIPFLGPTPFVVDFGFPLLKERDDDEQVISFTLGSLPY